MKKGVMLGVLFITILLSTSFISANWWGDWFGPGLSPEDESVIEFQENVVATFRGNQGPWEHQSSKGGNAKPPTLALEGIFSGQVVTMAEDPTGIYSLRIYPKKCIEGKTFSQGKPPCTNDIETQCDVGTIGTFTNDENEKIGDDILLVDFKKGIPVPEGASKLYVSILDRKTKYLDNSGGSRSKFNKDNKLKYADPCSVTFSVGPEICYAYADKITSFINSLSKDGDEGKCSKDYVAKYDINGDGYITPQDALIFINLGIKKIKAAEFKCRGMIKKSNAEDYNP